MSDYKQRPYDFIVFGATGVTGKRAAETLAQSQAQGTLDNIKWAIAGRNESNLKKIRDEIAEKNPKICDLLKQSIGIVVADVKVDIDVSDVDADVDVNVDVDVDVNIDVDVDLDVDVYADVDVDIDVDVDRDIQM